jgi:predicted amidohydrolase
MALVDFKDQLKAADSVLDLARRLGELCLASRAELDEMRAGKRTSEELDLIEKLAGQASYAEWEEAVNDPAKLDSRLGAELVTAITRAKTRQPLDFLGVLRGLCSRALGEFFAVAAEEIELVRGLPVPIANRPVPDVVHGEATTKQETLKDGGLLHPLPFDLYSHVPAEELRVVLDFSQSERLDALTWNDEQRLPLIATLHPRGGDQYDIEQEGGGRFFGVRPAQWDIEVVKKLLKRAKAAGARLAVLPELSLPHPGALERELADNPSYYPAIVVAGSAHCETLPADGSPRVRANESRIYLEGQCVTVARKNHSFKTKKLGTTTFKEAQLEDLSKEQKTVAILSGRRTRFAVAICADLLEAGLPRLLVDAGVNLLLTPAMTPKIGSFNSALTSIAGLCQGVAAVANTRWGDDGMPFLCMCAVPYSRPEQQSAALAGDGHNPAPELAIFDPNKPLPDAVSWPGRKPDSE